MAAEPKLEVDAGGDVPLSPEVQDDEAGLPFEDGSEGYLEALEAQEPNPPKRKGGRKPIYATVEERKQRNRQAQAAFRERRTEYIKQLENTLKHYEELLQMAQRERQVLAYQSSSLQGRVTALERILREHGLDIEHELRIRGEQASFAQGSSILPDAFSTPSATAVRRPVRPSASTGSTKLDLLKAKTATARSSVMSPLSSPQSQASTWTDPTSPQPSILASPASAQHDNYHLGQSAYQRPVPVSSAGQPDIVPGFPTHDRHVSVGQTPMVMENSLLARHEGCIPAGLDVGWNPHSITTSGAERSTRTPAAAQASGRLTMPEGFSQEIFPLTHPGGSLPFPGTTERGPAKTTHPHQA